MHKVSIVIPAYNAESTIEKALISALNQTEQDIEIIVIDDCSTDSTEEVVKRIAHNTSKIQYYRLPQNLGRSGASNFGTSKATGKWIAVLDADDWYAPERLERLLSIAENSSATMIADNQIFIDTEAQKEVGTAFRSEGRIRTFGLTEFLEKSNALSPFDYGMLKPILLSEFIERKSINYYEPARNGQDFYYLLSFFAAGGTALVTDDAYYYYAQPFGSISRNNRQHKRSHYNFELMKQVNNHFIEVYKKKFSKREIGYLSKRSHSFDALISMHLIRSHLKNLRFKELLNERPTINCQFFKLVINRLIKRASIKARPMQPFLDD